MERKGERCHGELMDEGPRGWRTMGEGMPVGWVMRMGVGADGQGSSGV